jgi:dTDP-4-amino-4,6-dideoxygalactose transaminase
MRNYGIQSNYNSFYPGANGKMSEFHAIVGLHNLRRIDVLLAERQKKARILREKIETLTQFRISRWPQNVVHTFKDFTIVLPKSMGQTQRDRIISLLAERQIETRAYFYPPVHEQEFFKKYVNRPLPQTEDLSRRVITLPFFTTISEEQMDFIVESLLQIEKKIT